MIKYGQNNQNNFYCGFTDSVTIYHEAQYSYHHNLDMSTSYGKQTTSEIIKSGRRDLNGDGLDLNAERAAFLSWAETPENLIVSGSNDLTRLSGIRGAILKLKD